MRYSPHNNLDDDALFFDIETVSHEGLASDDGGAIAPSTQRPIVLGMANMTSEYVDGEPVYKLQTLASIAGSSEQLAEEFFKQIKQRRPKIVSFNGKGFDVPVLKNAALEAGIDISSYICAGRSKWESYESPYDRDWHFDCMDVIAGRSRFPKLDHIARRLKIPAKMGVDGAMVQGMYDNGEIEAIRRYCDFDVLTTVLVFLHLQRSFYGLPEKHFKASTDSVRGYLLEHAGENPHFDDYNMAWGAPSLQQLNVESTVINLADKLAEIEECETEIPF